MASRGLRPSGIGLLRWAADAQISPDGERVAWVESGFDLERDTPVSNIMVAPSAGGTARQFTHGPADLAPRWSPDGRHLAYLSVIDGAPALHLAPLTGGVPLKVQTPGPVGFVSWSPTGDSLALVVTVTPDKPAKDDPKAGNVPKLVRGMANRLDGRGYLAGRDHIFVYGVEDRSLRRLTSGDYDHAQPSWSPDATTIALFSNRSARRDDQIEFADLLLIPAAGGRPLKLVTRVAAAADPSFSPDGKLIAFVGIVGSGPTVAGRDTRLFVVPADRSGEPAPLARDLDRPVIAWAPVGNYAWSSNRELLFKVADRGTIGIRRARVGQRLAEPVLAGERQIGSFTLSRHRGRRLAAFAAGWLDRPSEVFCLELDQSDRRQPAGGKPGIGAAGISQPGIAEAGTRERQISDAGRPLLDSVDLFPSERFTATARDGTEIEYFVISPRSPRRAPPMVLEIHGGPNAWNPTIEFLDAYQTLAAAGYAVVLPNPRGSMGYGEAFSMAVNGDWGGEDHHDLLACADDAIHRGLVDGNRQFVSGYSYGGYMSAWLIGQTRRFRAASVGAPVIDLVAEFGASDIGMWIPQTAGGDPWHGAALLQERSPLTHIPDIDTPVLLYVFEGDLRCPPDQADALFNGLRWHRKEVEYVRYPGGSHLSVFALSAPPSQCEDRLNRVLAFLGRHGGAGANHAKPRGSARRTRHR